MYKYLLVVAEFGSYSDEVSRQDVAFHIGEIRTAQLEELANKNGIVTYHSMLYAVTVALI